MKTTAEVNNGLLILASLIASSRGTAEDFDHSDGDDVTEASHHLPTVDRDPDDSNEHDSCPQPKAENGHADPTIP